MQTGRVLWGYCLRALPFWFLSGAVFSRLPFFVPRPQPILLLLVLIALRDGRDLAALFGAAAGIFILFTSFGSPALLPFFLAVLGYVTGRFFALGEAIRPLAALLRSAALLGAALLLQGLFFCALYGGGLWALLLISLNIWLSTMALYPLVYWLLFGLGRPARREVFGYGW